MRLPLLLASLVPMIWAAMPQPATAQRPNFVIMMTDDQRADAMSCAGNAILHTPNMDRLAAEGIRFRNMFVTNSLCAPSRASILTGLYSHAHGVIDNKNRRIAPDQPLFTDLLRAAGYEVAFCGKSHVAGALRDRQWDYYFGYKGQGNYLKPVIAEGVDGQDTLYEGYMDDVVTDHAVAWLRQRRDKPFCLLLWFKAPHRSWERAPRHQDLFADVAIPKPDTWDERAAGSPGKPRSFHNARNVVGAFRDVPSLDEFVKNYYATLIAVDENVGKVYEALQEIGKLDDTAIFYTSDNGFFHGEWQAFDKRFMHEPSIRVPLLVRYPKRIKAGSLDDHMVLNIDIAPTVLDLAGLELPPWMHGRSMVKLFAGEPVEWRKDWLYQYFEYPDASHNVRAHRGIRTERYKLIHYYPDPDYPDPREEFELYDLENDLGERNNQYGQPGMEELATRLFERMQQLRRETGEIK
jgi:arylsulfatase A-like enzyme